MPDELFDNERRPRPRSASGGELVAWLLAALMLIAVAAGVWAYLRAAQHARQADLQQAKARAHAVLAEAIARDAGAARGALQAEAAGEVREQIVDDPAGRLLWASPTTGPPISLAYMPPGAQCFFFARPRELMDHSEGEKVLAALGPWGERATNMLQASVGLEWRHVKTLLVAATTSSSGDVEFCARLQLTHVHAQEEIDRMLGPGPRRVHAEQEYSVNETIAAFVPWSNGFGSGSWLVFCPEPLVTELIDSEGEPPIVARDLETLVAHTDADRTATLLTSTGFLSAGATRIVSGEAEPLRAGLAELVGRDATAVALSVDWGDKFFVELAAAPALTASPRWLATTLVGRLGDAPDRLPTATGGAWPEYSRAVLDRFPAMIARLSATTRGAASDNRAVLRAYLPVVAGHNLLMATELLLAQSGWPAAGD
jgi:hypothetical protein